MLTSSSRNTVTVFFPVEYDLSGLPPDSKRCLMIGGDRTLYAEEFANDWRSRRDETLEQRVRRGGTIEVRQSAGVASCVVRHPSFPGIGLSAGLVTFLRTIMIMLNKYESYHTTPFWHDTNAYPTARTRNEVVPAALLGTHAYAYL